MKPPEEDIPKPCRKQCIKKDNANSKGIESAGGGSGDVTGGNGDRELDAGGGCRRIDGEGTAED